MQGMISPCRTGGTAHPAPGWALPSQQQFHELTAQRCSEDILRCFKGMSLPHWTSAGPKSIYFLKLHRGTLQNSKGKLFKRSFDRETRLPSISGFFHDVKPLTPKLSNLWKLKIRNINSKNYHANTECQKNQHPQATLDHF